MSGSHLIFLQNRFFEINNLEKEDVLILSYFAAGKLNHIKKDFPENESTFYLDKLLQLKKKFGVFLDGDLSSYLKQKNQYQVFQAYYELFYTTQKLKRFFSDVSMVKIFLDVEYCNVSGLFLKIFEEHLAFFNIKVRYQEVNDQKFYFHIYAAKKYFLDFYITKSKKKLDQYVDIESLESYSDFFLLILRKINFFTRYAEQEGVIKHVLRKKEGQIKYKKSDIQRSKIRFDLIIIFLFALFVSLYAFFDFSKKNFIHGFFNFEEPYPFVKIKSIDEQIEKVLNRQINSDEKKNIYVALVGKKGTGKNSLARKNALKSGSDVVWEIDSSSRLSIMHSFLHLAKAISQTEKEKEQLQLIKEVMDEKNKLNYLLIHVQKILKRMRNWFLIYSNMNEFEGLDKFIPIDSLLWGSGKFIVTTSEENQKKIRFIEADKIIKIDRILDGDARRLFSQIYYKSSYLQLNKIKQTNVNEVLKRTPLYLFDVSVVASYLRKEKIPFSKYIQTLSIQESLLIKNNIHSAERTSDDFRRSVVFELIVKSIIKKDKKFEEVLFFISYLHFKDVSKSLLCRFFDANLIERFIKIMKGYSIFHAHKKQYLGEPCDFFVVNQNLQSFLRKYFFESYKEEEFKEHIFHTIDVLNKNLQTKHIDQFESQLDLVENIKKLLEECSKKNEFGPFFKQCEANIYFLLAKMYMVNTKEFKQTKNYFEKALSVEESSRSFEEKIYIYVSLCEVCLGLDQPEEALNYVNLGLDCLLQNKKGFNALINKSRLFYFAGCVYKRLGKTEKSKNYFNEALFVLDEMPDKLEIIKIKNLIKRKQAFLDAEYCLSRKNEFYSANNLLETFSDMGMANNQIIVTDDALNNYLTLGVVLCRRGLFQKAYTEIFEKITKNVDKMSHSHLGVLTNTYIDMAMGECLLRIGKIEKAITLLKNAVEKGYVILGQNANSVFTAQVFLMEGYLRLNHLDLAEKEFMQVVKFDLKEKNNFLSFLKCLLYYNAAILYREKGDNQRMAFYFREFFSNMSSFLKNFLPREEYKKLEGFCITIPSSKVNDHVAQNLHIYINNAKKLLNAVYKNVSFYG